MLNPHLTPERLNQPFTPNPTTQFHIPRLSKPVNFNLKQVTKFPANTQHNTNNQAALAHLGERQTEVNFRT